VLFRSTQTYTARVTDDFGAYVDQTVTVTINGTNDTPVVTATDVSGLIREEAILSDSGSIGFADLDLTDRPTASSTVKAITGLEADGTTALTLSPAQRQAIEDAFTITNVAGNTNNGTVNWSYSINEPAIRFLGQNETITAVFTVRVNDGQGGVAAQDITITIQGFDDRDGLSADSEERLANLVAQISGGTPGDLNGDGIPDARQPEVAILAWILADYFQQGLVGTLGDIRPIISVSAIDGREGMTTSSAYQLQDIKVLAEEDEIDLDAASRYKPDGPEIVQAPWDPIQFSVSPGSGATELADADQTQAGIQVRLYIDISRAQMAEDDFNAYYKYVSNDALIGYAAMGLSLVDLDGRPITKPGWHDFTQRVVGGDGARFVIENGQIIGIELTLTDNAFGDNDPTTHRISDPGLPVKIRPVQSPELTTAIVLPQTRPETSTPELNSSIGAETATPETSTPELNPSIGAETATPETTTPDLGDGSGRGGSGRTPWSDRMAQQARDSLMRWAQERNLTLVQGAPDKAQDFEAQPAAGSGRSADDRGNPDLMLNSLGPSLLDALALGAAGLFCTQAPSGRGWKQLQRWWLDLPLLTSFRWLAAPGLRQSVVAVFVIEGNGQRAKLVAAAVQHDGIDILVEQPLLLNAPLGNDWRQLLDLTPAVDQLLQLLDEHDHDHFELLLLDPQLLEYRKQLANLAVDTALLRHPLFEEALHQLNAADADILRAWLNRPSQTDLLSSEGCRTVSAHLANLQNHWAEYMANDRANVAGVLELSIALSNLQPLYAVI
jgi:VCBS repeat-containing protein